MKDRRLPSRLPSRWSGKEINRAWKEQGTLAIALGANLGDPAATLRAVRPRLVAELTAWLGGAEAPVRLRWSPLFRTAPVGGPPGQPPYLNAVLLVERQRHGAAPLEGPADLPAWPDPAALIERLQQLEAAFGRERRIRWGPRTLDLDLLWCGARTCSTPALTLPHPRLRERTFVIAPLAAIDPDLVPPLGSTSAAVLLADLLLRPGETPPLALPGGASWGACP